MRITVYNDNIIIQDATQSEIASIRRQVTYTDKSKQYQLKRMAKNPFTANSIQYKNLQKESFGCLLEDFDGKHILPSSLFHILQKFNPQIDDHRKDTGETISLPWVNKPYDLRPYQEEAVEVMLSSYRGVINFAMGLGKTLTAIHAIRRFKKKTLVICPNKSIAEQFYEQLCSAFGSHRIGFLGNNKNKLNDITVGIIATVNNRIDVLKREDYGLIIVDETHHAPANTLYNTVQKLGNVGRIFGLTATDFRSDGKDIMITAGVGPAIIRRDIVWGIRNGFLADPIIIMQKVNTTGKNYKEDKLKNYKEHVLNSQEMNDKILSDLVKMIKAGKSVLCLVDEVEHGKRLAEATGLPLAIGADKNSEHYVKLLNEGKIPGLIGSDSKIGEGTDTRRVDVLILANFVVSKGILWQCVGRGLRLYGNKKNLILLDYIPTGSTMLTRHAKQRIKIYEEITNNIKIKDSS